MVNNRSKGIILVFVATLLWGSAAVFIKFFPTIDSLSLTWIRYAIGGVFFSFITLFQIKLFLQLIQKKKKKSIILNTIYVIGTVGFYTLAVKSGSVASAAFLLYTIPLFVTTLYQLLIKKTQINAWLGVALAFSAIGILSIFLGDLKQTISLSNIWGLLAGISWGLQIIESRNLSLEYPTYMGLAMIFGLAAIVTLPFANFHSLLTQPNIPLLLSYGITTTIIAPLAFYAGIKFVNSTDVGIISLLDPIFASFAAFVILSEFPPFGVFIGSLFIIIGNLIQVFSPESKLPEILNLKNLKKGTYMARYIPGSIATKELMAEQTFGFILLFLYFKKVKDMIGKEKAKELLIETAIERRKTWFNSIKNEFLHDNKKSADQQIVDLILKYWKEINPKDITKKITVTKKNKKIFITYNEWDPVVEAAQIIGLNQDEMAEIFGARVDEWLAQQILPGTNIYQTVSTSGDHQRITIQLP